MSDDEARQNVFQLRQLNLNLALTRLCTLREDVEDELRAINHFEIGRFGDRTHLRGTEFTIKYDQVCAESQGAHDQFIQLAAPKSCARVNRVATLNDVVEHDDAGRDG